MEALDVIRFQLQPGAQLKNAVRLHT